MKIPRKKDMPHKLTMYRLLDKLLDSAFIANNIYFKGGTCAAMLGFLDRFSIDLDFDLLDKSKKKQLREAIHQIAVDLNFTIKDESANNLQFFFKYRDVVNQRNTLKLEISDLVSKKNCYKKYYLVELSRYCQAQTPGTMLANKLVALKARWEEGKSISGRDVYDIYYFFKQAYQINCKVIEDLRGKPLQAYLVELIEFIKRHINDRMLMEDLNPLLSNKQLKIIPQLKSQVLAALQISLG